MSKFMVRFSILMLPIIADTARAKGKMHKGSRLSDRGEDVKRVSVRGGRCKSGVG